MTDKVQKIREEVERIMEACLDENGNPITYGEDCAYARLCELKEYIDSLPNELVSEDLNEAAIAYNKKVNFVVAGNVPNEHFIAGAQWQKEQMMAKAIDVEVKVDAGGYPYIPQIELYDYDKDVPLAKEGDKIKIIIIKEN